MPANSNQPWNLESFVDSFIVELDKAQDTLSMKGLTRKLTYTVQDVSLDLHIFPRYRNGQIEFLAAEPGEAGASRLSMQLGSITNRQIKDVSKEPPKRDDIDIDLLDDLDDDVKDSLRQVGVRSVDDLERIDAQNVDLEKVVRQKVGRDTPSFGDLAGIIRKSRRKQLAPSLSAIHVDGGTTGRTLTLDGHNLVLEQGIDGFPIAQLNGRPLSLAAASARQMQFELPAGTLRSGENQLEIALDPFAVLRVGVNSQAGDGGEA